MLQKELIDVIDENIEISKFLKVPKKDDTELWSFDVPQSYPLN